MSPTDTPILRPKPRRPFDQNEAPLQPASPLLSPSSVNFDDTPSRTHSVLNLTSSTLLGIYSPTGYQTDCEESSTPWGTGAESPTQAPAYRRESSQRAVTASSTVFSLVIRSLLLFGLGMSYGLLVRHLHDDQQLAPFQVEGIMKPSTDWRYLGFWGVAGVALGSLLPWVDIIWEENLQYPVDFGQKRERSTSPGMEVESDALESGGIFGADWTPVVRSIGAFVGIAYAIRKLPWTSTLQASLTLALVNPVLWYIIDRSKPGFILSASVGATGTALLLASNPDIMPRVSSRNSTLGDHGGFQQGIGPFGKYISRESLEGGVWILSVLFCSCVCFGNIGRRLALLGVSRKDHILSMKRSNRDVNGKRKTVTA